MAAYWEIAAHSAYDMFSKYKYLIVNLFFPSRFLEWNFFLIIAYLYLFRNSMNDRFLHVMLKQWIVGRQGSIFFQCLATVHHILSL